MKNKRNNILLSFMLIICVILIGLLMAAIIEVPEARMSLMIAGGGGTTSSYLIEETFDGSTLCATGEVSTCDNTWVESQDDGGTADVFDADSGDDSDAPLEGTYSYFSPDPVSGQNEIQIDFGAQDEVWVAFMVRRIDAIDSAHDIFRILDTGQTDVAHIEEISADNKIRVGTDGGFSPSADLAQALTLDTTVYVKIRYKKGTGNDAICEIWATTSTSSWGTSVSSTDGDGTNDARYFQFNNYYGFDGGFIADKVVIDDADIPISYYQ